MRRYLLFSLALPLWVCLFFDTPALSAAPTVTVSATAQTLLGTNQTISLTVDLVDPNNTGLLRVNGTQIVPIMTASTVTPGATATVGPIYGNDVIKDGFGNLNSTYYRVRVFTVINNIISSTAAFQQFFSFTGAGTVDLATATPLAPSFMTGTSGSVVIPGALTVSGNATFAGTNTFTGPILCKNFESVRCAAQFTGADWCAKVTAADGDLSTTAGEIWVDQSAGQSACTAAPTLTSNHTLRFIQAGTYPISVGWTINEASVTGWNIYGSSRAQTIISFTGSAGFTVTGPNVGVAGPNIVGVKFNGNASIVNAVTLTQVWRGQFDFSAGNCTGYAVILAGSLLNTGKITVSGNEGSFTTTPSGGVQITNSAAINGNDNDIYYVIEGVSGTGINIHNGTANIVRGTSEGNARGIQIDSASVANNIINLDTEVNSTEDILDGGNFNLYVSDISTNKIHITGNNNRVLGGEYNSIQIDSGAKGTELRTNFNSLGTGTFVDNGTNTVVGPLYNIATNVFASSPYSSRDSIPPVSVAGIGTPDSGDMIAGTYTFTTAATLLSNTVVTAAKPWRVLFIGQWSNNFEGGGLAEVAPIVEFTSAAPTVAIGTPTVTISLNGSNQFQAVTSANTVGFSGRIILISNNLGAAGTSSFLLKGSVQTSGVTLPETTAPSGVASQDVCYGDSTLHAVKCSYNNGTFFQIPQVITATSSAFATATTAGTCVQNTTAVTGAATTMAVSVAPVSTPGVGAVWSGFVSSSGNVTINECAVATSAGGSIAFNIRVTP